MESDSEYIEPTQKVGSQQSSKFSEQQLKVLVEIEALLDLTGRMKTKLQKMVDMTSTGGKTVQASESALKELEVWRDLFKSVPNNAPPTEEQTKT